MNKAAERVLELFEEINTIPRQSKNEEEISRWLIDWAINNGFEVESDSYMDVLIKVPASLGYENAPAVILQGHMDMVCEKTPESDHDFSRDPIKMYRDGEWLKAKETTLGADNGIAMALAMALATDEDVCHPALELLFTVDEETGLTGAVNLGNDWLTGKYLINLDSEDEGVLTVGCAGGRDGKIFLPSEKEAAPANETAMVIAVGGLLGGHSGVNIHEEKANANILLARFLFMVKKAGIQFSLAEIKGGSAHNAIARDSSALISLNPDDSERVVTLAEEAAKTFRAEFAGIDDEIFINCTNSDRKDYEIFKSDSIIELLLSLPHGVLWNSASMEGVVETSSNVAVLSSDNKGFRVLMSHRSSRESRLDEICNKVEAVVRLCKAEVEFGGGYPPWQPDMNSSLLALFQKTYKTLFNREPVVEAIHAGLECGVIGSKYPGMEMISIGPTIKHPHCPDEKLHLPTLEDIWVLLTGVLAEMK